MPDLSALADLATLDVSHNALRELDPHGTLVRRAATEALCNLLPDERMYEHLATPEVARAADALELSHCASGCS